MVTFESHPELENEEDCWPQPENLNEVFEHAFLEQQFELARDASEDGFELMEILTDIKDRDLQAAADCDLADDIDRRLGLLYR